MPKSEYTLRKAHFFFFFFVFFMNARPHNHKRATHVDHVHGILIKLLYEDEILLRHLIMGYTDECLGCHMGLFCWNKDLNLILGSRSVWDGHVIRMYEAQVSLMGPSKSTPTNELEII